jgi:ectoine hydroxylase-related dioxygenase (phytanoyl-CoA dioxygenase family)
VFDAALPELPRVSHASSVDDATVKLRAAGALIIDDAARDLDFHAVEAEIAPWFGRALTGTGPFFGTETKRFSGVFAKAPATALLAIEPFVLAIVERVLKGEDHGPQRCDAIQLNMTQAIGICPGQRAQVLHRDEVMFPFAHDFEVMVNVMWAFDPWTEANGATRIVPGSGSWPRTRIAESHEIVPALAPAGSAIIWLGSTIHGGGANTSSNIRRGLAFSYTLGWLGQAERLLLSTPPEIARELPERLQRLIGYQLHRPNLGWVEERDPIEWLHGRTGELAEPNDNLTPVQEALVAWRLQQEGAIS